MIGPFLSFSIGYFSQLQFYLLLIGGSRSVVSVCESALEILYNY